MINSPFPKIGFLLSILVLAAFAVPAQAQESPYIVAYDHYLEEPGSLEVEYFSTFATQRNGNDFHAFWAEFEYGATAWWTTELYLDGQTTFNDSTIFTGFRWENRLRLLQQEHFINPVFYFEYEQINGADKIMKEVEGHDVESDHAVPNALARKEPIMNWNSSCSFLRLSKGGTSLKTLWPPRISRAAIPGSLATPSVRAAR